jgi:hypothetical protein
MLNQLFQIAIMNDTNQALGCCGIPARLANAQSMVLFYTNSATIAGLRSSHILRSATEAAVDNEQQN